MRASGSVPSATDIPFLYVSGALRGRLRKGSAIHYRAFAVESHLKEETVSGLGHFLQSGTTTAISTPYLLRRAPMALSISAQYRPDLVALLGRSHSDWHLAIVHWDHLRGVPFWQSSAYLRSNNKEKEQQARYYESAIPILDEYLHPASSSYFLKTALLEYTPAHHCW